MFHSANIVHDQGRGERGKGAAHTPVDTLAHEQELRQRARLGTAAGEEKCPKAVLRPNNGRTDGSPGSPRRVRAYGGAGRGGRVWGPGRKQEALTTLKVKEGRRVDLGTGAFSHQLAKVDVSGYRHCMPTGCRAHAPPEILRRPAVPSWRAQLTPQSWVGRVHPSGSQKLTLGKLPPSAA